MTTVSEFKQGAELPKPIYLHKSYVILGSKGDSKGVVMDAGDLVDIEETLILVGTYYDDCEIDIRRHDMYANNNKKIAA